MGFVLGLIFALSLLVRGAYVTSVPPELFGDEVDVGYQAYSLLKTGRDMLGQVLPTYIRSLAEWRAPILIYATVPTIAVFGNTELGVRMPQVIFGSLAPVIFFLLVHRLTCSRSLSFISAFVLTLTPWHIHYSRAAFEVVIMLNLILLGTLTYLRRRFAISLLFFALSMYTYSTAVLFVPLWILSLLAVSKLKPSVKSLVFYAVFLVPLGYHIFLGPARDRFALLSIFNNQEFISKINDSRASDLSPVSFLWHNKIESFGRALFNNYLRAYSSEFLFVRGDPAHRHSIQVIGQLLPVSAPFILFGLYFMAKRKQKIWLAWLLLAPLPSIVTSDGGYHATRLFHALPPLTYATAAGIFYFIRELSRFKTISTLLVASLFIGYFAWASHYYLTHYPKDSWRWWHVGFKSVMHELEKLQSSYSRVFINNTYEPALIRYLFYTRYPPEKFHRHFTLDQPQPEIVPGYDGFSLDGKVFFGAFSTASPIYFPGALYVISQRDDVGGDWDWRFSPPPEVKVLFASTNPLNMPVLYLVTKK